MRCTRSPLPCRPRHVVRTVMRPSRGSKLRSCATRVPSLVTQLSRPTHFAITPSREPPNQASVPPGASTRANSRSTRASSAASAKKPNEVKRLSTASKRPAHSDGSARMSPRT